MPDGDQDHLVGDSTRDDRGIFLNDFIQRLHVGGSEKSPCITPQPECQEENEIFGHFNGSALIVRDSPLCYYAAREYDERRISKRWVCHCQKLSGSQAVRLSLSVFLVIEDEQVDDR